MKLCTLIIASLSLWPAFGFATCVLPETESDLVIAIRDADPFTVPRLNGRHSGLAIELWEDVAETLGSLSYAYAVCENIESQEIAMASGEVDVVISPFTITSNRLSNYGFTQAYLSSGLSLATPRTSAIDFGQARQVVNETIFRPTVFRALILFLLFNLVMAYLIKAYVIKGGGKYGLTDRQVLDTLMRTFSLKGIDGEYRSAAAKTVEIFMAVVGTILSATLLGVITTAFVGSVGKSQDIAARELSRMNVATLQCSTAQAFLLEQYGDQWPATLRHTDGGAHTCGHLASPPSRDANSTGEGKVTLTQTWTQALELLEAGEVDAVLGDWIAMSYQTRKGALASAEINVQGSVYRNEPYGWAISPKAPDVANLTKEINRALIAQMRDVNWRSRLIAYLGDGAISPN